MCTNKVYMYTRTHDDRVAAYLTIKYILGDFNGLNLTNCLPMLRYIVRELPKWIVFLLTVPVKTVIQPDCSLYMRTITVNTRTEIPFIQFLRHSPHLPTSSSKRTQLVQLGGDDYFRYWRDYFLQEGI